MTVDELPMPPMPPASFGPLPDPLPLPAMPEGDIRDQPTEVAVVEATKPRVEKYVPKRRAEQAGESESRERPAPTQPTRTFADAAAPPASSKEAVDAAWRRYIADRERYEICIKRVFEHVKAELLGDEVCAGPHGFVLFEWGLVVRGSTWEAPGLYANMVRGPKDKPVVLKVTDAAGRVQKFSFVEGERAAVKELAAAIRKRGKRVTGSEYDERERAALATLLERVADREEFVVAATNYASVSGQSFAAVDIDSAIQSFPRGGGRLAHRLTSPGLDPPLSGWQRFLADLTTEAKIAGVVGVFIAVWILTELVQALG